ncbi:glycosyltransferase [Limobrevibacterium gyesilva]|nr:glycosyltransferase [Limobrevibacterium gyesilva]
MVPAAPTKVLVATHSHPAISKGGAEIAAWRLYEALAAQPGWDVWFMGCVREPGARLGSAITQPFGDRQFLYASSSFDWFKFSNLDKTYPRELEAVLRDVVPDILHFHHYVNFGVETFLHIKRILPDSRIVLTLHEFQAICNHYGQMVTKQKKNLCYEATLRDCNKCFPEINRADFFLRKAYVMRFFDLVDHFISPSQFLAERYVAWGLPAAKMSVIENVIAPVDNAGDSTVKDDTNEDEADTLDIGYFGQISFLKGIHVLLEAAAILEDEGVTNIRFDIHGDYSSQPEEFQTDFLTRLDKAGRNVRFHGAYDNQRVDRLMRMADAVLVPSIWWENSPVVIQECLRNKRPIICSNIGGMAEKVRPGQDGFHFPVGSAAALAALLRGLAKDRKKLTAITRTMQQPDPPQVTAAKHVAIYDRLLAGRPAADQAA